MNRRRALLGLLLTTLSLVACTRDVGLRIDSVEWQTMGPTLLPAGGSSGQPGSTDEQIARLNTTQCLWKGGGEQVQLSWRSVVHGGTIPDTGITSFDSCTGEDNFGQRPRGPVAYRDYIGGQLRLCGDLGGPNPNNECRASIDPSSCSEVMPLCQEALHPNFPYCQPRCTLDSLGRGTYRVISDQISFDSPPFRPAIYVVTYSRSLIRRLELVPDASNPESQTFVFRWAVADNAGVWEENFSPALLISKVRVFRPEPAGNSGRRYMQVHRLTVGGVSDRDNCSTNPQDPTEITLNSCPALALLTPAYSKPALSIGPVEHPVAWEVELRGPDRDVLNQGLSASSALHIEFVVNSTVGNDASPRLSPPGQDLGRFVLGRPSVEVTNAFRVDNDLSGATWTVAEPTVQGRDAASYRARLDGDHTLQPGGSVRIAITFAPTSPGVKQAGMAIVLTSGARQALLSGSLTAMALGPPSLSAQPNPVQFPARLTSTTAAPWRRNFFIENAGSTAFGRTGIVLTGNGASAFQILDARGGAVPPEYNVIAPGASEQFTVEFCPARSGFYTATVSFPWLFSAGDALTVGLEGDAISPCVR